MDIQKEREAFELWCVKDDDFCIHRYDGSDEYSDDYAQCAWLAWKEAKTQAVPNQPTQFNLDEFLIMEEKLKLKGSVIAADLDRFIAYAESVLIQAKALKEPK